MGLTGLSVLTAAASCDLRRIEKQGVKVVTLSREELEEKKKGAQV